MITQNDLLQLDIEQILDSYGLEFRINGSKNANFMCPFHNDRNPSCGMHIKTGLWKCFGCGLSGNLVQFVAEIEQVDKSIAEDKIRKIWIKKIPDIDSLQKNINDILLKGKETIQVDPRLPDWILNQYTKNWDYMYSRGFNDETLEYFNVLYDPKTKLQGFPVHDDKGKLVGITGRQTQPDIEPRYFPVMRFRKSNFLFNLHRIDISKPVIAVEGEINCIAMHQHGFSNTISFLGAGVSQKQLDIVRHVGIKELILFFDSDLAGQAGEKKIFTNLWIYTKIKSVDEHDGDPNTLSTNEVKKLVKNADYFVVDFATK